MPRSKAKAVPGPEAEVDETAAKAPVYDERGNVRPHGTPGARHMTYDERVEIAQRLARGEEIATTAEQPINDDSHES